MKTYINKLFAGLLTISTWHTSAALDCGDCWYDNNGACTPEEDKVTLGCTGSEMTLSVRTCVMGQTNLGLLELLQDNVGNLNCSADKLTISEKTDDKGDWYEAKMPLECAIAAMTLDDKIKFTQKLQGTDPENDGRMISMVSKNSVEFSCSYPTDYQVSDNYEVEASVIASQGVASTGAFAFKFDRYLTDQFTTKVPEDEAVRIGSTMYFQTYLEQSLPESMEFSVIECTVSAKADPNLTYKVLENGCPNQLVDLVAIDNLDRQYAKFSMRVFEFRAHQGQGMVLACKIKVCEDISNSACKMNPGCDATVELIVVELESEAKITLGTSIFDSMDPPINDIEQIYIEGTADNIRAKAYLAQVIMVNMQAQNTNGSVLPDVVVTSFNKSASGNKRRRRRDASEQFDADTVTTEIVPVSPEEFRELNSEDPAVQEAAEQTARARTRAAANFEAFRQEDTALRAMDSEGRLRDGPEHRHRVRNAVEIHRRPGHRSQRYTVRATESVGEGAPSSEFTAIDHALQLAQAREQRRATTSDAGDEAATRLRRIRERVLADHARRREEGLARERNRPAQAGNDDPPRIAGRSMMAHHDANDGPSDSNGDDLSDLFGEDSGDGDWDFDQFSEDDSSAALDVLDDYFGGLNPAGAGDDASTTESFTTTTVEPTTTEGDDSGDGDWDLDNFTDYDDDDEELDTTTDQPTTTTSPEENTTDPEYYDLGGALGPPVFGTEAPTAEDSTEPESESSETAQEAAAVPPPVAEAPSSGHLPPMPAVDDYMEPPPPASSNCQNQSDQVFESLIRFRACQGNGLGLPPAGFSAEFMAAFEDFLEEHGGL